MILLLIMLWKRLFAGCDEFGLHLKTLLHALGASDPAVTPT